MKQKHIIHHEEHIIEAKKLTHPKTNAEKRLPLADIFDKHEYRE
jgi:hypothetical protein